MHEPGFSKPGLARSSDSRRVETFSTIAPARCTRVPFESSATPKHLLRNLAPGAVRRCPKRGVRIATYKTAPGAPAPGAVNWATRVEPASLSDSPGLSGAERR